MKGEGDKEGKCTPATATWHCFKPGFTVAKVSTPVSGRIGVLSFQSGIPLVPESGTGWGQESS